MNNENVQKCVIGIVDKNDITKIIRGAGYQVGYKSGISVGIFLGLAVFGGFYCINRIKTLNKSILAYKKEIEDLKSERK